MTTSSQRIVVDSNNFFIVNSLQSNPGNFFPTQFKDFHSNHSPAPAIFAPIVPHSVPQIASQMLQKVGNLGDSNGMLVVPDEFDSMFASNAMVK